MPAPLTPGPAEDVEDRDAGLARERTELAWTRTAISFAGLGAAMLRTNAVAGAFVMVAGAAVWALGQLPGPPAGRRRRLDRRRTGQLITGATTLVSLVALILAILAPGHGPY
jgi:uncharacterized membrane protein YidH (DUF202 family)